MKPLIIAIMVSAVALAAAGCTSEQEPPELVHIEGLGSLYFSNSGALEAQDAFLRGVLLLHSFEFGPATEAFREAQSVDPDFLLAYWGEAMTYNHPLWREVDVDKAHEALARFAVTREDRMVRATNPRERMYLEAVEALYGPGTKAERDKAYMEAMAELHRQYPDDDEATAFYALSILGSLNGERDFEVYARAARTVEPIFEKNPNHPGAAHYIIHSYDDPLHAEQALDAANAYSEIAPNAAHAQHMTTHIFVALGIWDRVVANNIRAMNVQNAERAAAGRKPIHCGHYSSWRHYGHLQLNQLEQAEALLDACYASVQEGGSRGEWAYFASMRALHIIDTEDWSLAGRWQAVPPATDRSNAPPGAAQSVATYHFSNMLAAIRRGDTAAARQMLTLVPDDLGGDKILRMELEGLLAIADGKVDEGISLLDKAVETEAGYPLMFGPPKIVKPTYELLGEELLRAGRIEEATQAFEKALARTPGRRVTVAGAEAVTAASA